MQAFAVLQPYAALDMDKTELTFNGALSHWESAESMSQRSATKFQATRKRALKYLQIIRNLKSNN